MTAGALDGILALQVWFVLHDTWDMSLGPVPVTYSICQAERKQNRVYLEEIKAKTSGSQATA